MRSRPADLHVRGYDAHEELPEYVEGSGAVITTMTNAEPRYFVFDLIITSSTNETGSRTNHQQHIVVCSA